MKILSKGPRLMSEAQFNPEEIIKQLRLQLIKEKDNLTLRKILSNKSFLQELEHALLKFVTQEEEVALSGVKTFLEEYSIKKNAPAAVRLWPLLEKILKEYLRERPRSQRRDREPLPQRGGPLKRAKSSPLSLGQSPRSERLKALRRRLTENTENSEIEVPKTGELFNKKVSSGLKSERTPSTGRTGERELPSVRAVQVDLSRGDESSAPAEGEKIKLNLSKVSNYSSEGGRPAVSPSEERGEFSGERAGSGERSSEQTSPQSEPVSAETAEPSTEESIIDQYFSSSKDLLEAVKAAEEPVPAPKSKSSNIYKTLQYVSMAVIAALVILIAYLYTPSHGEKYQLQGVKLSLPYRGIYKKKYRLIIVLREDWRNQLSLEKLEREIMRLAEERVIQKTFRKIEVFDPDGTKIFSFSYDI